MESMLNGCLLPLLHISLSARMSLIGLGMPTADDLYVEGQNPVSAISLLALFVVHTRTSHTNLYEKPGNGARTLSREEMD